MNASRQRSGGLLGHFATADLPFEACDNPLMAFERGTGHAVEQQDLMARIGGHLRNARPHRARTRHSNDFIQPQSSHRLYPFLYTALSLPCGKTRSSHPTG